MATLEGARCAQYLSHHFQHFNGLKPAHVPKQAEARRQREKEEAQRRAQQVQRQQRQLEERRVRETCKRPRCAFKAHPNRGGYCCGKCKKNKGHGKVCTKTPWPW